ncbi:SDR family oxidoreductase [Enterobacter sp. J706]|uniref:SDR family oxidoreductase n=1 Tax=Enterobacter sp. J706 TaxID=3444321 RepID=UPI003EC126F3
MNISKSAIVTGASRGIGAGIALRLAKDGFAVAVNYAGNEAAAQKIVDTIIAEGGKAFACQADVSKSHDVQRLFEETELRFGGVDVLVNNAGKAIRKQLSDFTEAEFDEVVAINLKGAFLVLAEASRRLRDSGRIINISASFQGAPIAGYGPYSATKLAIEKLTEVAAKELGSKCITVNAIRPGPTRTDLFMNGKNEDLVKQFAAQAALGRIGEPKDIADVVAFLVSEQGGWVTGQAFGVNGGYW